ncbi:hypothetical protein HHK36_008430 [Tetracentron sinense]|uniref:Uncharacterized protein n=1 Tax=Tetracentron sinense TaxID=13715 RepID=A0A834ZJH8_TETSI|nr:hypothetical protein HHK36_008430 [Tetracentron sinense]
METEVAIPVLAVDFNFDSACSSPFISAPSTPKRFGEFYFSAPTSPTRASAFYHHFNNLSLINVTSGSSSVIPFDWEESSGKPKSNDDDFEFDFSGQFERASVSAEELFDGGTIRTLNPPSGLQLGSGIDESATRKSPVSSPRSPRSPFSQGKKMFREAFSPRQRKDKDPFGDTIEETRKGVEIEGERERVSGSSSLNSERSWEEKKQQNTKSSSLHSKPSLFSASTSSSSSSSSFKRLKDFLLFRSASEGRAADKDPLRKYTVLSKKNEGVKNGSFRSTDSSGSVSSSVSRSRRRGPVSAHELHYKVNRAVSEKLKKKTFLPYKQGLLGCLGFNPAVHGLAKGFGSLTRG